MTCPRAFVTGYSLQHSLTDIDTHIAQSVSPTCLCAYTRAVVTCAYSTLTMICVRGCACIDYFPHIARHTSIHNAQYIRTTSMWHTKTSAAYYHSKGTSGHNI
jgi:hypothetical protein